MQVSPPRKLIALGVVSAILVLVAIGLGSETDYRFDRSEFQAALHSGADREVLKGFYQRPRSVPLRSQAFPVTESMRRLGEKLFFDTRLGGSGKIGCVTCHDPTKSFSDNLPQSAELSRRRSMTLYDLAWNTRFGWNGSIGSLMAQAVLAIEAPGGMGTPRDTVTATIASDPEYPALMIDAYRGVVKSNTEVHFEVAAHALEVYVGSLISPRTSFDRWIEGADGAISEAAKRGFDLFNGRAGCAECHMSWRFTDGMTHDIGLNDDLAVSASVSRHSGLSYAFKTPGLREVGHRAPYMHDGSIESLERVILFYSRGGNIERSGRSPHVKKLGLSAGEIADLKSFLDTLTSR